MRQIEPSPSLPGDGQPGNWFASFRIADERPEVPSYTANLLRQTIMARIDGPYLWHETRAV